MTVKRTGDDGIFTRYIASIKEENIAVYLSQIRKAETVPPVKMGKVVDWRNGAVASSPDDSTFESRCLASSLPKNMPPGLSDLYLDIDYAGDVGRLYGGKRLLDDNFFNGTAWEIGLKRFGPGLLLNGLELNILPLRKDAPIYIPKNKWPSFNGATQIAEVKSVEALPDTK